MPLAADAVTFEDTETNSELVEVLEDCCSPSMSNMILYQASICPQVGDLDIF